MASFELYTRYYDLLYGDKDYAAEAAYVAGFVRARVPNARRILELGCGTGGHAGHLARMGFEVHGIDLSDGMLARAAARQAELPAEVAARLSFALGDARSVRVGRSGGSGPSGARFDAVISLFHVMSYQTANDDLAAAYDTAAAHLAPGGCFVYDYWYGPAVLSQQPSTRVRRLADDTIRVTRIAEPVLHAGRNVCDVNYTLFIEPAGGGAIERFEETHPMRFLFTPELALIEGTRWRDAEDRGWMGARAPGFDTWAALRAVTKA